MLIPKITKAWFHSITLTALRDKLENVVTAFDNVWAHSAYNFFQVNTLALTWQFTLIDLEKKGERSCKETAYS